MNTLRVARKTAGLSQQQLAKISGVDFTLVSRYERNQVPNPSWRHVHAFAQALGIPPEKLFPQKSNKTVKKTAAGADTVIAGQNKTKGETDEKHNNNPRRKSKRIHNAARN